jgi:Escherichia/Staphylococcus phage prohead protease
MTDHPTITRAFTAALELDGDGRTIMGRCVPYDTPTLVADDLEPYMETFKRGAFRSAMKDPARVHLVFGHDELAIGNQLGHAVSFADTDGGLDAVFRAVGSPGEVALEQIRAGMFRGLSIHAAIPPSGSRRRADGVIERTMVYLRHVALVKEPAYEAATVTALRSSSALDPVGMADVRARQDQYRAVTFPITRP